MPHPSDPTLQRASRDSDIFKVFVAIIRHIEYKINISRTATYGNWPGNVSIAHLTIRFERLELFMRLSDNLNFYVVKRTRNSSSYTIDETEFYLGHPDSITNIINWCEAASMPLFLYLKIPEE